MDLIRLKTKELQSEMYFTQTQTQTHRLRLIGLTKAVNSANCDSFNSLVVGRIWHVIDTDKNK